MRQILRFPLSCASRIACAAHMIEVSGCIRSTGRHTGGHVHCLRHGRRSWRVNHFAATNKPIDASIPPSADSAFAVLRRRQTSTATLTPQVRHLHSQLHDADPVLARVIDARPDFDPRAWIAQLPPMDLYGALLFQIVGRSCPSRPRGERSSASRLLLVVIFPSPPTAGRRQRSPAPAGRTAAQCSRSSHPAPASAERHQR
jgi:hypothetical protein